MIIAIEMLTVIIVLSIIMNSIYDKKKRRNNLNKSFIKTALVDFGVNLDDLSDDLLARHRYNGKVFKKVLSINFCIPNQIVGKFGMLKYIFIEYYIGIFIYCVLTISIVTVISYLYEFKNNYNVFYLIAYIFFTIVGFKVLIKFVFNPTIEKISRKFKEMNNEERLDLIYMLYYSVKGYFENEIYDDILLMDDSILYTNKYVYYYNDNTWEFESYLDIESISSKEDSVILTMNDGTKLEHIKYKEIKKTRAELLEIYKLRTKFNMISIQNNLSAHGDVGKMLHDLHIEDFACIKVNDYLK